MMFPSLLLILTLAQATPAVPPPEAAAKSEAPDTYTLGPGDQIVIRVPDLEEIDNKSVPIDMKGNINLPQVGRIQASGLTTEQLEDAIADRLKKVLVNPDVSVYLTEMRSQPVSVLGEVQTPGVHQLQGQKNLFEVLSLAGGLRPDAGNTVKITRRLEWGRLPLPGAADDPTGQFSVASVNVKSIMAASNPADNITIRPNDVISVVKADIIYVVGAVHKPGGFTLGENKTLSSLQLISLAEGSERTASLQNSKILRYLPGSTTREEIPLDLKKIFAGKMADTQLKADDILFVPTSTAKAAGYRTLEALMQGSSLMIYRVP